MKKTFLLTALLGLWGVFSSAEALNLDDAFVTMDTTSSHHFANARSSFVYTFAFLDLAEFKKLATDSGTSDAMLISYKNASNTNIGIGKGSYSGKHPLRFYNNDISTAPSGKGYSLTYSSGNQPGPADAYTLDGLDFTNVAGAVLTMGVCKGKSTLTCLTLMYADGTFKDYVQEATGYKTSANYTDVAVSSTYVDEAYVYVDQSFTKETLAAANHDVLRALVPEPTTATLTLLALAGLVVRRRRK